MNKLDTTIRKNIKVGMYVEIKITNRVIEKGLVLNILSRTDNQSGIKVELTSGSIGHIVEIYTLDKIKLENFKFYNRFIFEPFIYSIWDKTKKEYLIINYKHHSMLNEYNSIIVADNKEDLNKIIDLLTLDKRKFIINRLKSNSSISKSFKDIENIEMILINNIKYLRFSKFLEIENEIKLKSSLA